MKAFFNNLERKAGSLVAVLDGQLNQPITHVVSGQVLAEENQTTKRKPHQQMADKNKA